jgi:hypothetical protein
VTFLASPAFAQTREDSDRYELVLHAETQAELFRRALLPGPRGSIVSTDTVVPVHQYVLLDARELDTGWRKDSIDVELSAWGRGFLGERNTERPLDGDVQTASLRYSHGPVSLRLGRQIAAGGAARFVRFDGARLATRLGETGLAVEGYGGLTALPRWNERPGYHHLGSTSDSLLRDDSAVAAPDRAKEWLAGGRLGWASERANAGLSFHEQHETGGLSRRTLGTDGRVDITKTLASGGNLLVELDAERLQDLRVWLDATPAPPLDLSLEVLHTEPALFLSRQSVLSVFSTDAYDETGGSFELRPVERFALEGGGWIQFYDEEERGARGELAAKAHPGPGKRTLVRVAYGRVLAVDNGYHSVRASLSRRFEPALTSTLEAYTYLYDEAIAGHISSSVLSGTLGYQASDAIGLLWGASVAQSPYARLDAQTLVRVAYDFDFSTRGRP